MKWEEIIVKLRWQILIFSALFVFATAYGIKFITFESDSRVFFGKENPQLKALEALENVYTKENDVFFTIEAKDKNIFSKDVLSAIEELTEKSWQIPFAMRVDSITNYQHTEVTGDDLIVRDLIKNAEILSEQEISEAKAIALNEPILLNRLVDKYGTVTGVVVTLNARENPDLPRLVTPKARELKAEIEKKYPSIKIRLIGGAIFDYAFSEQSEKDSKTLIPAMLIIMLLILFIFYTSFSAAFGTVLVIALSSATAIGVAGWLGMKVNSASAMAPLIIITLGIADSVHIISTAYIEMSKGLTKLDAIKESIRSNMPPVFFTSITNAIGFLSMNSSDAPPFRDLGNIVAIGVVAAFYYSMFLLPAVMAIMPKRKIKIREEGSSPLQEKVGEFVILHSKRVFLVMNALILILMFGISFITFNDNFLEYFDKSTEVRKDLDFTKERLTGLDIIEFSLSTGEPNGINKIEYLNDVEAFSNWWKHLPETRYVYSITDIHKKLNLTMNGGDRKFYTIPESRELAAQYFLLYEMSLPYGLDLNSRIDVDKSATRFTVFVDASAATIRKLEKMGNEWLKTNAKSGMKGEATGVSVMFAHISERNVKSMMYGTFGALVLISFILVFILGSFKMGFISLIPNVLPAFIALGLWGYLVGEVGLAVSVVASMSLGIVVDDTVHFLNKYMLAKKKTYSPEESLRYAFKTVGRAVIVTSIIMTAGFGVLIFSGFVVNFSMGVLTATAIAFALILDLFYLPTILMKFDRV